MKYKISIIFLLLVLFISCTNVYKPLSPDINNIDSSKLDNVEQLREYGDAAMESHNFAKAFEYYYQIVTLSPKDSKARLSAAQAILLRDQVDFLYFYNQTFKNNNIVLSNVLKVINDTNKYKIDIFAKNGTLDMVMQLLDNTNGYSLVNGQCDNIIKTNNFTVNFNLIIANLFLIPAKLLDSNNDFIYGDTNSNGDVIALDASGNFMINLDTNTMFDAFDNIAVNMQNDLQGISVSITNPLTPLPIIDFQEYDNAMKSVHDSSEALLQIIYTFNQTFNRFENITKYVNIINTLFTDTNNIISSSINTINSTMDTYMTNDEFSIISNIVLLEDGVNELHYGLVGEYTYNPSLDIDFYTYTSYPEPFDSSSGLHYTLWNILYVNYTNITNLQGQLISGSYTDTNFLTNFLSTNIESTLSNLAFEFTNEMNTNLLSIISNLFGSTNI